jgi:hypothetical protein
MQKMMFQKTIEYLRPNLSAIGAAIKAPIKVPIESRATINPDFQLLKARPPVSGSV